MLSYKSSRSLSHLLMSSCTILHWVASSYLMRVTMPQFMFSNQHLISSALNMSNVKRICRLNVPAKTVPRWRGLKEMLYKFILCVLSFHNIASIDVLCVNICARKNPKVKNSRAKRKYRLRKITHWWRVNLPMGCRPNFTQWWIFVVIILVIIN